jgi:23S rRNA (uracil1939-C5)-methyltransferase
MSATGEQPTAARPRRGEELDLEVTSLAQGGRGVARSNGFVVFVAGALPGDVVRARLTKSKRSYGEATVVERIRPSPERRPDSCVHAGEPCPGAPWQGLAYERQLEQKSAHVAEALERIGELEGFELQTIEAAPEEWRYRNKLEYSFGQTDDELVCGFHRRGSWEEVLGVEDCLLASEANNGARNAVRDWAREQGIPAYDPRTHEGVLRNLVVRDSRAEPEPQTRLVTSPAAFAKPPVDLHTVVAGSGSGTAGPTGVLGRERIVEELCGLRFEVSPMAFLQTNSAMAERLYDLVSATVGLTGAERVFDLFCGIGTIALRLARDANEVWGLESVPEAVADAERNAEINRIENATFLTTDARLGIRPLIERAGKPDVVVVDPPRAGLSKKIVRRVIECEARRIIYVSCNPTTLAPNAAQLVEAGYRLRRVRPLDLFPQTPHVECVALLER